MKLTEEEASRKRSVKSKRAYETRWMYYQEKTTLCENREAVQDRPMAELRDIAYRIWTEEAPGGRKFPQITSFRGIVYLDKLCSYCEGYTVIKLARHHRNLMVLIHELTHALGPRYHGKTFVQRYFPLLWKYAGYDKNFLIDLAAQKDYVLDAA